MGDISDGGDAKAMQTSFQSKELESLLDMIDKLRAQGISHIVDLPQLIVCGDQSSGKSSVLEAVSGVRFPTKDNLCTRFPTELILRRSSKVSTSITIVPDANRTEEEKSQLKTFRYGLEALDNFGDVVEAAGKAMGLDSKSKVFSNDVLRVELTGPKQPHLTLVDLPGLFHAGNKSQSTADAQAVKALVTKYMEKPRSIILAVVSAKNDYANQIVTKYAHDVDPLGERTLGIITKPDTLHAGSESEKQFFELAENKDVSLRLGWHILRNRDFNTKDCTSDQRDQAESEFFSKGIWSSLRPSQMGIVHLRPRLSRALRDHILVELPDLTKDVETCIKECKERLERLGVSRASIQEQRKYLHKVSQDFSKVIKDAVAGHYHDQYFNDSSIAGYPKRIRAVVANLLDAFAEKMRTRGKKYLTDKEESNIRHQVLAGVDMDIDTDLMPQGDKVGDSIKISREQRLHNIATLIVQNRGRELPGFNKFETVTTLFREQCQPWQTWIKTYTEAIYMAVQSAVHLALEYTADQTTKEGILRYIVNPALDGIKKDLEAKVILNLRQHLEGHPITLNHYFTENIQNLRNEHAATFMVSKLEGFFGYNVGEGPNSSISRNFTINSLTKVLTNRNEADMKKFTCSEALHFMEAYYKVALKFVIDDFSIHTIEQGLLEQLGGIFEPGTVFSLSDQEIADIAGETEESQIDRASSSTRLAALEQALKILRQLDRGRASK